MTEEWKPIPDFAGYEVSDLGNVRCVEVSKGRKVGRNFKPNTSQAGYRQVRFRKGGRTHVLTVHRLVVFVFRGPCPDGMQVRHLDGDKDNNALANLVYGTPKENGEDRVRHGTSLRGQKNPKNVITEAQALQCMGLLDAGQKPLQVARVLGVSPHITRRIARGEQWAWLKEASNRGQDRSMR
jgi:hypothetical protein